MRAGDPAAAGLPAINLAPNQGKLLHLLAKIRGAKKILEIGTLGGYSTIWMAWALPSDGRLTTLEFEPKHAAVAAANIATAGLSNRVDELSLQLQSPTGTPSMRLLITADLHYNHPRSRPLADELIDKMNAEPTDVLILIGDTAAADGDALERCLSRFTFTGPKLFVAGNHELWTHGDDSYRLFTEELPRRVRNLGWHWLETEPFVQDEIAIVGSVGWYDFSFASKELGIPKRFYAAKVSPGAAERFSQYAELFKRTDDILPISREVIARWNDGKFVKLHRSDEEFLQEILDRLHTQLVLLAKRTRVIACIHHLPFRELLPPPHSAQWDFVKAFLGSERIGQLLLAHENVRDVFCGHSHFARQATIGNLHAVNIGSGYRSKTYKGVQY